MPSSPIYVLLVRTLFYVHPSLLGNLGKHNFGIPTYRVGEVMKEKVGIYLLFPVIVSPSWDFENRDRRDIRVNIWAALQIKKEVFV